jgi:TolA-binding protein
MKAFLTFAGVLLLAAPAFADAPWWNSDWSARRPVAVTPPDQSIPGDDSAVITFFTAGLVKPDGSDLRVIARGQEMPVKVYGVGPGDLATIGFKVDRMARECHVYFGNPSAPPRDYRWEPQRGLILETRGYAGGNPNNLQNTNRILASSTPFHGAGPVDRVWQGHNLFGPTDRFVSRYVGFFRAAVDGEYSFATSSDDASFLLVNGKEVVSWPGWHGPVADARHNASVKLPAGMHRLEYLHVSTGGSSCAVAAWRTPGAKGFEPIPASAFSPLSRAITGPLETTAPGAAGDFACDITGQALLSTSEDLYAVKVSFADRTTVPSSSSVTWDFGDGQSARGRSASHVYLADGLYAVTMTLGSGPSSRWVTNRIHVHQHWGWQTQKEIDDINSFLPEIARYDIDKLDPPSCLNLMTLAREKLGPDVVKRAALSIVARSGSVDAAHVRDALVRLEDAIGFEKAASDDALVSACAQGFKNAGSPGKAVLALWLSDVLLERGAAGQAATFAKAALADDVGPARRLLFIAVGDAARYLGDAPAARAAYAAADAVPIERTDVQRSALSGGLALKVESAVRDKEYAVAEQALDAWDLEKPLEKLQGYSSYLRASLYRAAGRDARALLELQALAAVSPESPFAPRALLLAAKIHAAGGNSDAAKVLLDKIVQVYPLSPEVAEAKDLLRRY